MSGAPQESVLGLVLLNVLIGDMDSGIEYTLSEFTNDTKLNGAAEIVEESYAIQKDLDRLKNWVNRNPKS